jgi:hypothetical protein
MKRIAVMAGYWSTNIGNSFFQLGAEYLLQRIFPKDQVVLLSDQPGYWNVNVGSPANALVLLEHLPLDYVVILGPYLRPQYAKIWLQTLKVLQKKGVRILALSAGMMDYRPAAVQQYRAWLADVPPFVMTTRDAYTYEYVGDLAQHAYDGIDAAFFVSDLYEPLPVELGNYVVFNFDKVPEPEVRVGDRAVGAAVDADSVAFEFEGEGWRLRFPPLRTRLSHKYKFFPFLDAFLPASYPERVGKRLIVRTDHRFNPFLLRKGFKGPNSFASDVPYSYLTLYANATLTLSNRVHACVATVAYGGTAMLFSKSPRARLLERVGLTAIKNEPMALDLDYLAEEKATLIGFLRSVLD